MIDRDHALPITRQAQLLGMSRGAVYYMPRPTSAADLALMRRIDELHLQYPFMGARQLRRQLQREGVEVGRRHIGTLMRHMGIEALAPQPGTSKERRVTRSTRTCCASWRLPGPTRSGRWIRPTSRWHTASCT